MIIRLNPINPIIFKSNYGIDNGNTNRGKHKNSINNLKAEKYNGNLSNKTRRHIKDISYTILRHWQVKSDNYKSNPTRYKPSFNMITLTLSENQRTTDQEIKRVLLNTFIETLRRRFKDLLYIWRAEKQQNGNIHFHLIINKYIDKVEVQWYWNRILSKQGYNFKGLPITKDHQPPSTKIESIRSKKGGSYYIAKYISKPELNSLVLGKQWGSNIQHKRLQPLSLQLSADDEMAYFALLEEGIIKAVENDYIISLFIDSFDFVAKYCQPIKDIYYQSLLDVGDRCKLN